MLSRCLPPSFRSIRLTVWERITIQDFKDGHHGYHHGYDGDVENWDKILTDIRMRDGPWSTDHGISVLEYSWISVSPTYLPPSFGSSWLTNREQLRCEDFQDGHLGGHLRYRNRTSLLILNLYVAPMPPIKFELNLHFGLVGDVVWRISRQPYWMPEWKKISSSESRCLSYASHQVSA